MRSFSPSSLLVSLLVSAFSFAVAPTVAGAEERATGSPPAANGDLRVAVGLGAYAGPRVVGLGVDATLIRRYGVFETGGVAGLGGGLGLSYFDVGGLAGLGFAPGAWRIDVLGQGGLDMVSGVGSQLLSSDPGVSGVVPFVGARLGVTHRWGVFELGTLAAAASDVARPTQTYSFEDIALFGGSSHETRTREVGATRYTVMLTLGGGWDL